MTVPVWRRSSRCAANGSCVEVGHTTGRTGVLVADSADPDPRAPVLALSRGAFAALLTTIKEMP